MKIIRKRAHKTVLSFNRVFHWVDSPGSGFVFHCDEKGNVALTEGNRTSFEKCLKLSKTGQIIDNGIERLEHSYVEPAIGNCPCGNAIVLDGFTNSCSCGRDFNMSGQELAPREQWGEETGESLSDIYRIR